MTKRIGIFGTSGFAREVGDIAMELGYCPTYFAKNLIELDEWNFAHDVFLESEVNKFTNMSFAIGIGENTVRQKVAERYAGALHFENLIHPSATFGVGQKERIAYKKGVTIGAGVRFTNNCEVGDFTIFNLNATIGHDVIVDDYVNIAPGACISGNVHIGKCCWIGTGAVINQGDFKNKLMIGAGSIVGSGSVVVKACEINGVYVGVPAKRIK